MISIDDELSKHCNTLGIDFQTEWISPIKEHLTLLNKWAPKINLSSVTAPEEALVRHVVDSLSLLQLDAVREVRGCAVDIGSGAGFPGIPLSIALPHLNWTLVEPRGKRGAFLNQVIFNTGLSNCTWFNGRVPHPDLENDFDLIVSRATFAPSDLIEQIEPISGNQSVLAVMAAADPKWDLPSHWNLLQVCQFELGGAPRWIAALRKEI